MGVWIEDEIAYHDETRRTRDTLMAAGHRFLRWQDGWAKRNLPPNVDPSEPLFYHVSLSLAAELAARGEDPVLRFASNGVSLCCVLQRLGALSRRS